MKRMTAVVSAAAIVLMAVGVFAQAKPSFAGKWMMEAPAGGGAPAQTAPGGPGGGGFGGGRGGGRGGWGMAATITQDATTLTVEYTQGQNPVKLVYKLDGTENKNMVMGRGGQVEQVSKASWDGAKLKIVTQAANGETTLMVSLEGDKLVLDSTGMGRDGAPMITKTTYSKAP